MNCIFRENKKKWNKLTVSDQMIDATKLKAKQVNVINTAMKYKDQEKRKISFIRFNIDCIKCIFAL